jgi:hypothetical protein
MVVRASGVPVGYRTIRVMRTDGGFLAVDRLDMGAFAQLQTEISLDRRGRVRWVQQGGSIQGIAVRTTLEYRANRVRGVAVVADTSGPLTVLSDTVVPPGTIDDLALTIFLPTLPWADGAVWTFPDYVADLRRIQRLTLSVVGPATVSLPSGPAEAWEARLTGGAVTTNIWVSRAAPHRVLRIEFPEVRLEYLLVD